MTRFDRYLARTVLAMSGLMAVILLALFSFISFVGDIDETGRGTYTVGKLGLYTALMMPTALYTLLPLIALLGTLAGLGIPASQSELTALRAAGVSTMRLAGSALMAGAVLAVLTVLLGDWLGPATAERAERLRTSARQGIDPGQILRPVWLRAGDEILHVRRVASDTRLEQVDLFRLDGAGGLSRWAQAEGMRFENGGWVLETVQASAFEPDRVTVSREALQPWEGELSPEVLRLLMLQAESTSIAGLMRLLDYLEANGLDIKSTERALWRKLTAPFLVLALTLFAVPFVFGSLRESGMGQRLFIGVLIGVTVFVANEVSGSLGQLYQWPPWLGAGLPGGALIAIALWRLHRLR